LSEHLGEASFFAVLEKEMRTGNVAFETYVVNSFRNLERHRGVKAAELLSEMGVDEVWMRVALDGNGAGYALKALGIDILATEATMLRELVSDIEDPDRIEIKSMDAGR
jgi:predicted Fe-Mo cluster-binding NifX family protein